MYSAKKVQVKVIVLLFNKTFTNILTKYFNCSNIFLMQNIIKLLKYIIINDYIINLKKDKQLFLEFIYNLKLMKLKMLKIYIKINLANNFIELSKSLIKILIFLIKS